MGFNINSTESIVSFSSLNTISLILIVTFIIGEYTHLFSLPVMNVISKYQILFMTGFLLGSGYLYMKSKEESDKTNNNKNITNIYLGFLIANIISYGIIGLGFLFNIILMIIYFKNGT